MKIKPVFIITLCITLCSYLSSLGQEAKTNQSLKQKMALAQQQMLNQAYEQANNTFRNILATEKVLPTNLSYLFAETLYQIGQYQNSKNFLEKYLKLAGKGGDYYDEAIHLENLLNNKFSHIHSCGLCDIRGYRLTTCDRCLGAGSIEDQCYFCKGQGKTSCQLCSGQGVIISSNVFGEKNYVTCHRCESSGIHSCPVCEGEKKLSVTCPVCLGSTVRSSSNLCTHDDIEETEPR